jgi:GT2 family glycosyltransferase
VRVTALVVTWDSDHDITACLAALDAQDHEELEIVVLDNASCDRTCGLVETHLAAGTRHPTRLVRLAHNHGFCGAVNLGVRGSQADAVLLVNPDATLDASCVARLVEVLEGHPDCGTVQPKLLRPRREGQAVEEPDEIDTTGHLLTRARLVLNRGSGEPDDGSHDLPGEVFGASGACVLHRRAMLDDIARPHPDGGEDREAGHGTEYLTEDLVAYFDDVELDLRARMRGWTARYEPRASGRHARSGTARRRRRRVRVLNLSNHLLVIVGAEGPRSLWRDAAIVGPVWLLRLLASTLRSPLAMLLAIGRLRLLPRAIRRGRADRGRARIEVGEVVERWMVPLPPGWLAAAARRGLR